MRALFLYVTLDVVSGARTGMESRMQSKERTAQQQAAAALGREASRLALGGRSPQEVGREKTFAALNIVYDWGCSAPRLLDEHLHHGRAGFTARLVKQGLLEQHPLPGLGRFADLPAAVVTLSDMAVELVEVHLDAPMGYDKSRVIALPQIRHDLWVQRVTLQRLRDGKATGYLAPRQFAEKSLPGRKQPDAVWVQPGARIAYELELTRKKGREFDQACEAIIRALETGRFSGVRVDSPVNSIVEAYKAVFKPGHKITAWQRDDKRKNWVAEKTDSLVVSRDVAERIRVLKVPADWMRS
jgi:hypothetical protein